MSDLKSIYQFLKSRNLVRHIKPEYEESSPETVEPEHKPEFLEWLNGLPAQEKKDFLFAFGEL